MLTGGWKVANIVLLSTFFYASVEVCRAVYGIGSRLGERRKLESKDTFTTKKKPPGPKSGYYEHFVKSLASQSVRSVVAREEAEGRLPLPPPPRTLEELNEAAAASAASS